MSHGLVLEITENSEILLGIFSKFSKVAPDPTTNIFALLSLLSTSMTE